MNVEFEEFSTVEEIFTYMASIAPPMKNYLPINSYRGYICSIIPLSQSGDVTFLMVFTKGSLDNGILEFDINTNTYKKVESILIKSDFIHFFKINLWNYEKNCWINFIFII